MISFISQFHAALPRLHVSPHKSGHVEGFVPDKDSQVGRATQGIKAVWLDVQRNVRNLKPKPRTRHKP